MTQRGVRCNHKGAAGVLYPLEKALIFIHKPVMMLPYADVEKVTMSVTGSGGLFTLAVQRRVAKGEAAQVFEFGQIDKKEDKALTGFLEGKNVKIIYEKAGGGVSLARQEELDAAIAGVRCFCAAVLLCVVCGECGWAQRPSHAFPLR